jgi:nitroreductase
MRGKLRELAKKIYYGADILLIRYSVKSVALTALYYILFNRAFFREQTSVLAGRLKYYESFEEQKANSSPLLRRNIHRLEKGLIMRPMRAVFAKDYIMETVHEYIRVEAIESVCTKEKQWAKDVLASYFKNIDLVSPIDNAHNLLANHGFFDKSEAFLTQESMSPYPRNDTKLSNVTHKDFNQLCVQRRSVRWFKDTPVDITKLERAIDCATLAPSACNRQPYSFWHFQGEEAVEVASYAMGTTGFAQNIPSLVVVVGDLSAYPFERDRHIIYIDGSLAAMSFMLALETLGLSSCPINWPDIESRERKMDKHLKLDRHQRAIMLIAVGEALEEGKIPFSQKKDADILLRNN